MGWEDVLKNEEWVPPQTVQDMIDVGSVRPLSNPKWLDKNKEYDCEWCDGKADIELPDRRIRTVCKKCLQIRLDRANKKSKGN